jgi:uncharacterized membrane protein
MYSKAKIAGHPIHPMLVAFPIAFYTATLVGFAAYALTGNPFWFRIGVVANIAGVGTALLAAVPGFIDWAFGVPTGSPAKTTGMIHMLVQVGALVVFAINAVLQWPKWDVVSPTVGASIVLPLLGVTLTMIGGALGWKLIGTHHVGVELTPEQERLEPRANAREHRIPARVPSGVHRR